MEMVTALLERRGIDSSSIEVGLDLGTDGEGDKLGCYYICDKSAKKVYFLHPTENAVFYDGEDVKILGGEHLGKLVDG